MRAFDGVSRRAIRCKSLPDREKKSLNKIEKNGFADHKCARCACVIDHVCERKSATGCLKVSVQRADAIENLHEVPRWDESHN